MSPDGLESTSQVFTSAADLASSSCTEVRITTVFPDEAHPTAWSNVTQLAPSIRVFTLAYALILPFKDALTEMSAIEEARFDISLLPTNAEALPSPLVEILPHSNVTKFTDGSIKVTAGGVEADGERNETEDSSVGGKKSQTVKVEFYSTAQEEIDLSWYHMLEFLAYVGAFPTFLPLTISVSGVGVSGFS